MLSKIGVLWLAAFPLMGSPGPATLSLAAIGSAYGFSRGLPYYLGIVSGTAGVLLLIATGLTGLLLAEPAVAGIVTVLAAAYILYLAWKIATAPVGSRPQSNTAAPAFYAGFLLAIANPKAFAAIGAVYSGNTLITDNLFADAAVKIAALTLVIIIVNAVWLAAGNLFSTALSRPRTARAVNVIFALLLVASVGSALLTG